MINYEGGFVRRGMFGQLLFWLSKFTGFSPYWTIVIFCFLAYILVLIFMIKQFHKHKYIWWLMLSPFLLCSFDTFIRKDYLCYIVLIAEIYYLRNGLKTNIQCWILALLSCLGIFLHEAFIFFGVPFVVIVILRSFKGYVKYLPILFIAVIFLLQCYFHGNNDICANIVDSWNNILPDKPLEHKHNNSIGALGWTTEYAFNYHLKRNFLFDGFLESYPKLAILWRIIFYILSYYFITNFLYVFKFKSDFDDLDRWNVSALYLLLTLCMLPMFLFLSCDNGRLYQYLWIGTFVVVLLLKRQFVSNIFGDRILGISKYISDGFNNVVRPNKLILLVLLLCFAENLFKINPLAEFYNSPLGSIIYWIKSGFPL